MNWIYRTCGFGGVGVLDNPCNLVRFEEEYAVIEMKLQPDWSPSTLRVPKDKIRHNTHPTGPSAGAGGCENSGGKKMAMTKYEWSELANLQQGRAVHGELNALGEFMRRELLQKTRQEASHPDWYKDLCFCRLCTFMLTDNAAPCGRSSAQGMVEKEDS